MMRVGLGWDFHQLIKKRKLLLGGINVPFHKGEKAHSDGDVLLHAITDAILGAAGFADIGELFPPSDAKWKDANSSDLLKEAWIKVKDEGWELVNLDALIILEKPKLLEYRPLIRQSIANILDCEIDQVFVKAKTFEKCGPIGKGKGIQAQAVCLLRQKKQSH